MATFSCPLCCSRIFSANAKSGKRSASCLSNFFSAAGKLLPIRTRVNPPPARMCGGTHLLPPPNPPRPPPLLGTSGFFDSSCFFFTFLFQSLSLSFHSLSCCSKLSLGFFNTHPLCNVILVTTLRIECLHIQNLGSRNNCVQSLT